MKNKDIVVIGLGYIGLPTALFFAKAGYHVIGVDVNENIVNSLKNKQLTFEEKGMQEVFDEVNSNIDFVSQLQEGDVYIITVPTPFLENKKIDEKYIDIAVEQVSEFLKKGDTIILESTVPPKTTEKIIEKINNLGFEVGKDVYLAHVPETIIPGNMMEEFKKNKRVIGGATPECTKVVVEIYEPVVDGEIIKTDMRTAEYVKVIENTFRDVNIALANELWHLADEMNIDINEAISIANKHPRVNIHNPGPGVGGHCISVDPWFLVGLFGDKARLINTARNINDNQPQYIFDKLKEEYDLKGKKIGVYGLSYKPNIDDFRESPSFTFIEILKDKNLDYISFDPYAVEKQDDNQVNDFNEFLNESDIVVVYVAHDHIKENNEALKDKKVFKAMHY